MACILDYLAQDNEMIDSGKPFHYMDAFVFAVFAYLPTGADVRGYEGESIHCKQMSIGEFCRKLQAQEEILEARYSQNKECLEEYKAFINAVGKNTRYKDIRILDFVFENDPKSQFACYVLGLGEDCYCIAYRGTDGTYAGWYENFMMINDTVKAQELASQVLEEQMKKFETGTLYLTGHSKGGNLSVYAGIDKFPLLGERIGAVYNFDGPGFNKEFLEIYESNIALAQNKVYAVFIENCVVGELLFGQEEIFGEDIFFVKAEETGNILWQHCPFKWEIEGEHFVFCSQSILSSIINEKIDDIVDRTPPEFLKEAIELFLTTMKIFKGPIFTEVNNMLKNQGGQQVS